MTPRAWIGVGAAVAALGVAFVLLERRPPAGAVQDGPLFAGFERERVQKIEVEGKSPEEGIVLEKGAQGWVVPAENNYPAEPDGVREILDFVSSARADRKVSENPDKRSIYEVDGGGLSVRISGSEDATLAHFVVGKSGPDFMSTYVRPEGSDAVYLVDESLRRILVRPGPKQWRDKAIFRLSGADITRLKWTREGKSVALEVDPGGNWTLKEPLTAPALRAEVEALRNALATLQSDDFAGGVSAKQAGLESPWARLEFALRDGTTHTLEVGAENDRSQRHVRRSGRDTIFLVNNFRIHTVLKSVDDLKAPPPQPEPAALPAQPEPTAPPASGTDKP